MRNVFLPFSRRAACRRRAPAIRATARRAELILVIAIDQMRFDFLERFAPLYRSGLKTLIERGAVFTNAKYRHAATETGPGHQSC